MNRTFIKFFFHFIP